MACYFCIKNIKEVDYKETETLRRFLTGLGKIRGRKITGLCAKHQRQLSRAIKRARQLALLSPTSK